MRKLFQAFALLKDRTGRSELSFRSLHRLWPVLRPLAGFYRRHFLRKVKIVAVIGSLGKTTTTDAVRAALGLPPNTGFQSNAYSQLALKVLRTSPHQKHEVIETGISAPGQMRQFARMLRPDIVIVTSIASEHIGIMGTIETTIREKSFMLEGLRPEDLVILNGDDENVSHMQKATSARAVHFGFGPGAGCRCIESGLRWPDGMHMKLDFEGESIRMQTSVFGRRLLYPLMAAFCAGRELGISLDAIRSRLETFRSPSGRMNVIRLENGAFLIRDDYKSTYESIEPALRLFKSVPAGRRILVMGDSIEMPLPWQESCHYTGERIAEAADLVFFIGDMGEEFAKGAVRAGMDKDRIFITGGSWKTAFNMLPADIGDSDIILVKGIAFQRLQRFSLALTGEDIECERTWCEVRSVRCEQCTWKKDGANRLFTDRTFVWNMNQ